MRTTILFLALCAVFSASAETYKCKQAGRTIYSQQPCGDNATVVESRVSVLLDPAPHPVAPAPAPRVVQQAPAPQVVQVRPVPPADCKYQESVLENIRSRMRAGYTAAQSEYLHELQREAMAAVDACKKQLQGL
jgi:hypothetical protein